MSVYLDLKIVLEDCLIFTHVCYLSILYVQNFEFNQLMLQIRILHASIDKVYFDYKVQLKWNST